MWGWATAPIRFGTTARSWDIGPSPTKPALEPDGNAYVAREFHENTRSHDSVGLKGEVTWRAHPEIYIKKSSKKVREIIFLN